jgi:hypothetical protein
MPEYPAAQEHVKLLMPSLQVAPFLHGAEAHSLLSVAHRVPE